MWIMTGFGILMPAIRPPKTIARGDLRTMQVRTRRAKDLDIFRAQYCPTLGPTIATPEMDYNYRAYVTPDALALGIQRAVLAIDYLKFKPSTEDRYGDSELHDVYNAIWSTVTRLNAPGFRRRGPVVVGKAPVGKAPVGKYGTTYPGWDDYTGTRGLPAAESVTEGNWERIDGVWTRHGGPRDTRADRDVYNPDPALEELLTDAELDVITGDLDEIRTTDLATLYAELDALRAEQAADEPSTHTMCTHGTSNHARDRCRRKYRRGLETRIEALHERIDRYYDALDQVVNTGTESDPTMTDDTVVTSDVVTVAR